MYASSESSRRLSITKSPQAEAAGADLLALLCSITADGQIERSEVERLRDWLFAHAGADLPAITFLAEIVVRVMADGAMSESEATEIYIAIERVLPVTERGIAHEMRELAEEPAPPQTFSQGSTRDDLAAMTVEDRREKTASMGLKNRGDWRTDPMTDAQRNYIKGLRGAIATSANKGEASLLIDQLLRKKPISSRQQMGLRFWNRQPGPDEGPREISEWQDLFYAEDSDRKAAWELFKLESGDNGLQGDPLRVPIGAGPTYLARVKKGGTHAVPKLRPDPKDSRPGVISPGWRWILGMAAAGVVSAIVYFVSRPPPRIAAPIRPTKALVAPPVAISAPAAPKVDPVPGPVYDAAAELKSFARAIHFTALVTIGSEHVAIINGVHCRVGAKIGRAGVYTLTEINPASRSVLLTDGKGNSVRRTID